MLTGFWDILSSVFKETKSRGLPWLVITRVWLLPSYIFNVHFSNVLEKLLMFWVVCLMESQVSPKTFLKFQSSALKYSSFLRGAALIWVFIRVSSTCKPDKNVYSICKSLIRHITFKKFLFCGLCFHFINCVV